MTPRNSAIKQVIILAFGIFCLAAACRGKDDDAGVPPAEAEPLVAAAGNQVGFICTGTETTFGCACKKDVPESDILSCKGMKKHCEVLGKKYGCDSVGYCSCGGKY